MTIRHHIEFMLTDNSYPEIQRTGDYEELAERYDTEHYASLEAWQNKIVEDFNTFYKGRVKIWLVTREEIDVKGRVGEKVENG